MILCFLFFFLLRFDKDTQIIGKETYFIKKKNFYIKINDL